ncbi:Putative rRNA methylase [Anaerovirgula multivorans]|uniref:Putative rRNA methylase n=1 Tax=Anaerovirgula multivorans TaxID=312168 RepID=A0A238ZZ96_9FIRM|nr:class I SAM-dependent methyltransferase [Anaerovirgula multivorans]SNR88472.1 Putative rRNA methylase [Anaerovirgula multivorans]
MNSKSIHRTTDFLHSLLRERIHQGGTVVDATMGNGHDTLFLWEQVSSSGIVYAFDIQQESLEKTRQRFKERDITIDSTNIKLILDGHENMEKYITQPIDAVMFNLGYLPGGAKEIVTNPNTTIKALSIALSLLKKGGIISFIIYYGHLGGMEEKNALLTYVNQLEDSKFTVLKCSYMNHKNNPPIILIIEKK